MLTRIYQAAAYMLKTNPALVAALVNVGVAMAAHFGFHVTADQLVAYTSMAAVFLGLIVRGNVVPLNKLDVQIKPVALEEPAVIKHDGSN